MRKKIQRIFNKYEWWILLVVTAFVFFIFNLLTPYTADDYVYMDGRSLLDIIQKEYEQYMNANGRSVAHFFARSFLTQRKLLFDIVNTGVFLWLTVCIYFHANGIKKKMDATSPAICYLFIPCALWLFIDVVGQTCLWLTGSCNYLWGATWIMSALLPYSLHFLHNQTVCRYRYQRIGLFLLSFIAGWSSENTSGAMILIILCWMIYGKMIKRKWQSWMFYGLIGSLGGFCMLLFSPGHAARLANMAPDERSMWMILAERFKNATEFLFTSQLVLLLLCAFFIVLHIHQKRPFSVIFSEALFGFAALACEYALIFSPGRQTDRTTLGVTILLVIACTIGLYHTEYKLPSIRFLRSLILTVLVLFTIKQSVLGAYDIVVFRQEANERVVYTKAMIAEKVRNIQIPMATEPSTKYNAQYGLTDFSIDINYWCNRVYRDHFNNIYASPFYEIETIRGIPYKRWDMVYRHADVELLKCGNLTEYLKEVKKKGYTVFLTVQADASVHLNEEDKQVLGELGVTETPNYGESFLAVIEDGECVLQRISAEKISYLHEIGDKKFLLTSQGMLSSADCTAAISLNGTELTSLYGGLNIVVYSKEKDTIVDSANFRLWMDRAIVR